MQVSHLIPRRAPQCGGYSPSNHLLVGFFSKSIPAVVDPPKPIKAPDQSADFRGLNEPIRWIEPISVDEWLKQPGRCAVWFHSAVDASATAPMAALWSVPESIRGGWPVVLVNSHNFPSGLATRWQLHGSSEIIVWDDGVIIWKGSPLAGPGSEWTLWANRVLLSKGTP